MPDYNDLLDEYGEPNRMPVFVPVFKVGDYVHVPKYGEYGVVVRINWQGVLIQTDEDPPRFGGFGAGELEHAGRTCWDRLLETQKQPWRFLSPVVYCCATCSFLEVLDTPSRQRTFCRHHLPSKEIDRDDWCEKWSEALVGVDRNYA